LRYRCYRSLSSSVWHAPIRVSGAPASAQHHESGHWGYDGAEGPSHWAELNPEFAMCRSGHHQSPVDIRNAGKADLPPIQVGCQPSPLHIIDSGHTIVIESDPIPGNPNDLKPR